MSIGMQQQLQCVVYGLPGDIKSYKTVVVYMVRGTLI
jgi:hypothetical protein